MGVRNSFWICTFLVGVSLIYVGAKDNPKCCLPEVFEVFIGSEGGTNAKCSGDAYWVSDNIKLIG